MSAWRSGSDDWVEMCCYLRVKASAFACTCVQSPIVCATSQVISSIFKQPAGTNYLVLCGGCTGSGGIHYRDSNGDTRGYTYWDGSC